jgi:hypothetical protein
MKYDGEVGGVMWNVLFNLKDNQLYCMEVIAKP